MATQWITITLHNQKESCCLTTTGKRVLHKISFVASWSIFIARITLPLIKLYRATITRAKNVYSVCNVELGCLVFWLMLL
jgi:hypothetical protein